MKMIRIFTVLAIVAFVSPVFAADKAPDAKEKPWQETELIRVDKAGELKVNPSKDKVEIIKSLIVQLQDHERLREENKTLKAEVYDLTRMLRQYQAELNKYAQAPAAKPKEPPTK